MAGVKNRLDEITQQALEETQAKPESDGGGGKMGDLLTRFVTAIAMVGVTLIALWLGGWIWIGFVVLLAGLVLWEWNRIVGQFDISTLSEIAWQFIGALYVGAASLAMIAVRTGSSVLPTGAQDAGFGPIDVLIGFLLPIIAVDVGAYFAGRAIGGPRILPSVSPSKTWAGLIGGAIASGIVCICAEIFDIGPGAFVAGYTPLGLAGALLTGLIIAIVAQSGDFFESWMKRRAGVKDSSNLLPGHGGVFDRLDGFIAVFFLLFLLAVVPAYLGAA